MNWNVDEIQRSHIATSTLKQLRLIFMDDKLIVESNAYQSHISETDTDHEKTTTLYYGTWNYILSTKPIEKQKDIFFSMSKEKQTSDKLIHQPCCFDPSAIRQIERQAASVV